MFPPFRVKKYTILGLTRGKLEIREACEKLRCTRRTVERYRARYLSEGPQGPAEIPALYGWFESKRRAAAPED